MYRQNSYGLGDANQVAQNIQVGGSLAAGTASAIIGSIANSGGMILGLAASSLLPFVGPALMGVTMLVQELAKGCGQTCIVASNYANQAEDALRQNLAAYRALPSPRTRTQRAVAAANFFTIWDAMKRACQTPVLADAGQRCVTDRQEGACHYQDNGQCWNWFVGYLDPIRNDTNVIDDPPVTQLSNEVGSFFQSGTVGADLLPLALVGGLLALAVAA